MDLISVREIREPRTRGELALAPGELPLGGGTWLYSEPQPGATGLVDLTALGWPALTITDDALEISATCTIATLLAHTPRPEWRAWPLVEQCTNALLASFKVWNVATVGGNVALALPAGAMTSLLVTLDATALLWGPSGDRRLPVAELVTGNHGNALDRGEVIRSFSVSHSALGARTGFRRISLSTLGRTGTMVTARVDADGAWLVAVTGGCTRPHLARFAAAPSTAELTAAVGGAHWFDDAHGSPDWRKAMSEAFALELLEDLA